MGNDRDPQLDLNRPGIIPLYVDDENYLVPMMRSTDPVCVLDQSDCDSVEHDQSGPIRVHECCNDTRVNNDASLGSRFS